MYYNWPKFKYQLLSGTGWFSYKIWTKISKTPMVNLLKNLRPFQNYIFKIQWEIHFFTFLNIGRNSSKFFFKNRNMDILISNLLSESILDYGKWSNGKYTYTRICVFSVWPLPVVQNWFWKQIWNENVHISNLNFLSKTFGQYLKKVIKWISHCILKM